jgi:hypothetical protein
MPRNRWRPYLDISGTRASVKHKWPSAIILKLKQLGKKKIGRKIHLLLATAALVCVDTHTHNMTKPQCMYKQYVDSSHKTRSSKWRWWWWSIAETSGRDTYYKKDTKQNRNGSWNYRNTVRVGPYFKVHFTDELISARVSQFSSKQDNTIRFKMRKSWQKIWRPATGHREKNTWRER